VQQLVRFDSLALDTPVDSLKVGNLVRVLDGPFAGVERCVHPEERNRPRLRAAVLHATAVRVVVDEESLWWAH
jgi:hypothetical protein